MAHPPANIPHGIMHGLVVAAVDVRAYANALGASRNEWGDISCSGRAGNLKIKRTAIYRIETVRKYFDLSKVCGMRGTFRWPRYHNNDFGTDYDTWTRYEQLRVGDRISMRFRATTVQLSIPRCKKLGFIKQSFAGVFALPGSNMDRERKIYETHCAYQVPLMDVRIRWLTTQVTRSGAHGTDVHNDTWSFRIVGEGPASRAKTAPIGPWYKASLRPAW